MFEDMWNRGDVKMVGKCCLCDGLNFWRKTIGLIWLEKKHSNISYLCGRGTVGKGNARCRLLIVSVGLESARLV